MSTLALAVGALMISVVGTALLAPLMSHAGIELLAPTVFRGADLRAVQLAAIVAAAHMKDAATQAADDLSKLFSHGTQTQRAARNLLPDAATCEIATESGAISARDDRRLGRSPGPSPYLQLGRSDSYLGNRTVAEFHAPKVGPWVPGDPAGTGTLTPRWQHAPRAGTG